MVEIGGEGLDGVKVVLGQREGTGRRGRPGVHQRSLDGVISLLRPRNETAPIVHHDFYARLPVDVERGAPDVAGHDVEDDRIDLDARDRTGPECERRPDVATAS